MLPRYAAGWPFWLLIAAWVCANVPSTVMSGSFRWVVGTGHFSHYGELRQSVAALIAGEPPALAAPATDEHRSLPEVPPVERTPKKTLFALVSPTPIILGTVTPPTRPTAALQPVAAPSRDVPHPPPRAA